MIIIEGCDKTGKTTLANSLNKKLGFDIVKFNQPKTDNPYFEYMSFLEKVDNPKIVDRFHVGEFVYPVIYNRPMVLTRRHFRIIDLSLQTLGAIKILASTNVEFIKNKFKKDGEEVNKIQDIELTTMLFNLYNSYISTGDQFIDYDLNEMPLNVAIEKIEEISRLQYELLSFNNRKGLFNIGYQGSVRPDVLFVGERVNNEHPKKDHSRPFDFSPSSDLIYRLMNRFSKFAVINIFDINNKQVDIRLINSLVKPKAVIALGNIAYENILKQMADPYDVPVSKIEHPAYIKRFNISEEDYHKKLKSELQPSLRSMMK